MPRKQLYVQIVNEIEQKGNRHVRFKCRSRAVAEALNADLIKLFRKHHIDSAMGSYPEGEVCPIYPDRTADWFSSPAVADHIRRLAKHGSTPWRP